jgi:UDP-glucose 4-epimerase
MTILLTGATGTIGSRLLLVLLEHYKVVALGRNKPKLEHPNLQYVFHDFSSESEIELSGIHIDLIVHLAGLASGEGNTKEDYFRLNSDSVQKLINFSYKRKIFKIIYASSISVYGHNLQPRKESDSLEGKSHYALSKISGESLLVNSSLKYSILRFASIYGPNTKSFVQKLIQLAQKRIIPIPHLGQTTKSFIYIEDVIQCLLIFIKKNLQGIYNLAHPQPVEFVEIVNTIHYYFPKTIKLPIPKFIWRLETFYSKLRGKSSKLRPLFETNIIDSQKFILQTGYQFQFNFQRGIKGCL